MRRRMRRIHAFGLLVVLAALSGSLAARQATSPGPSAAALEVEKLRDNLFILRNADSGGNTAVFIRSSGVTVVDAKNPGWGAPILARIKELTPKPVTMIINT